MELGLLNSKVWAEKYCAILLSNTACEHSWSWDKTWSCGSGQPYCCLVIPAGPSVDFLLQPEFSITSSGVAAQHSAGTLAILGLVGREATGPGSFLSTPTISGMNSWLQQLPTDVEQRLPLRCGSRDPTKPPHRSMPMCYQLTTHPLPPWAALYPLCKWAGCSDLRAGSDGQTGAKILWVPRTEPGAPRVAARLLSTEVSINVWMHK